MADEPDPKLLQQIVSHPEFAGLLQTIAMNQSAQGQRSASQIPNNNGAPLPAVPAQMPAPKVFDPFKNRVPGKDQARVPQGRYGAAPRPQSSVEDALGVSGGQMAANEPPKGDVKPIQIPAGGNKRHQQKPDGSWWEYDNFGPVGPMPSGWSPGRTG